MTVGATTIDKQTLVTLEANGASIANNTIAQANDASYSIFTNGASNPHGRFVASFAFNEAPPAVPAEGTVISVYARPLNIISTNNAEVPETTRAIWVGNFVVNNVNTAQYAEFYAYDLPWEADYYLHNNGTGQTISAGWTLAIEPFTHAPAAA